MRKGYISLLSFFWFFLAGISCFAQVSVTQTLPSSAEVNNSVLVQVTINKGSVTGAAKFAEHLPAGFNAIAIDDEGAQTSFDSSTIAFSWSPIPSDGVLNISFRVDITSMAAPQNYSLTGRFFYTANNQKVETDCAPSNITITGGTIAQGATPAPSSAPQNNNTAQSSPPVQSMAPPVNAAPQSAMPAQNTVSSQSNNTSTGSGGGIFVVRQFSSASITPNADDKVTLTVHKANISGFAKIEDSIPPGFSATSTDVNGASFTFSDNRVKFVWLNLPSDSVFTISYHISAGPEVTSGTHVVCGNFSYINNDNPYSISIGSSIFNVSSGLSQNNFTAQQNPAPPVAESAPAPTVTTSTPAIPPVTTTNAAPTVTMSTPAAAPVANTNTAPPIVTTNTATTTTAPPPIVTTNTAPPVTATTTPPPVVTTNTTPPVVANTATTQEAPAPAVNTNNSNSQPVAMNENTASQPEASPEPSPATTTSAVVYRVQIIALRNPVDVSSLLAGKNIKEYVNTETEGGLTKYIVGNYKDYKSVKDARDDLRSKGFSGAFVVSYNAGVRIPVEEALKLTHQQ